MGSTFNETTRWCPVCEDRGVPILWGYPNAEHQEMADQGRVIIAGCLVSTGLYPSHVCAFCQTEFIGTSRIYQRDNAGTDVFGIGVWPHGRRSVRIEANDQGWTVLVARRGEMLIDREAMRLIPDEVFDDMWPWEVEEWAGRRGFTIDVRPAADGWSIETIEGGGFFELALIKTWWRSLGRKPVETALERLSGPISSPIWLPETR
ncbi:MAG: hypothetical protein ACRDZM_18630 [Acidimicrobiia bacterium]